jgi:hypothetical protein
VLHRQRGQGNTARLLGSYIDPALTMSINIDKCVAKARPKACAILKCMPLYMRKDLILQFKTHVWCHLELNTGGHYHACDTVLARLDSVQRNFIRSLDLSPTRAFLDYNLAPLCLRRDIAMLGFIYNAVHGRTHAAS